MAMTRTTGAKALLTGAIVAAGLMLETAAQARYSAVDDGTTIPFSGYCETRNGSGGAVAGDQCDETYKLPYYVDFGIGKTDKISLRDDGTIQFVGEKIVCDPADTGCFIDRVQQLKILNACDPVSNCDINVYRQTEYQVATINAHDGRLGSSIYAEWFTCREPTSCFINYLTVSLTPHCESIASLSTCDGFVVNYSDKHSDIRNTFIKAQFSAFSVPEPSTWALMILGFGGIGAALRSRRKAPVTAA